MVEFLEGMAFFILAGAAIIGALGTVKAPKVAHSMLFLVVAFLAVGGVFLLQGAELLAVIQVLVYLGSVLLVVLFGIMLTKKTIEEEGEV